MFLPGILITTLEEITNTVGEKKKTQPKRIIEVTLWSPKCTGETTRRAKMKSWKDYRGILMLLILLNSCCNEGPSDSVGNLASNLKAKLMAEEVAWDKNGAVQAWQSEFGSQHPVISQV